MKKVIGAWTVYDAQSPADTWAVNTPHNLQQLFAGDDLFVSRNTEKLLWAEDCRWVYETVIVIEDIRQKHVLEFKGLDYICDIYINDHKILSHEGMFSRVFIDLHGYVKQGVNTVKVVFYLPESMKNAENRGRTMKCQSAWGWDAVPRLLTFGIWNEVVLHISEAGFIRDYQIKTLSADEKNARVLIEAEVYPAQSGAQLEVLFGENRYQTTVRNGLATLEIIVENPRLWYPVGYGSPELYDVAFILKDKNQEQDRISCRFGIRTVTKRRMARQRKTDTPLCFAVNGKDIFLKGSNLVPMDVFPASLTEQRYRHMLEKVVDSNQNLVRVWGGGLIEKDCFYNLCDELGILVWQDFPTCCYTLPETEAYVDLAKAEATDTVKRLRNHPCILLWCGGNELYVDWSRIKPQAEQDKDLYHLVSNQVINFNPETFFAGTPKDSAVLKEMEKICVQYDGSVPFHVSTPLEGEGEIHGPWGYDIASGDYRYRFEKSFYDYWNNISGCLISEAGVSGIASLETYKKIISKDQQWPLDKKSPDLLHHNAFGAAWSNENWWLDLNAVRNLFGDPADLETLAKASEFVQTEGLRYLIHAVRRQRPDTCGIVLWALNETFPNAASLSILEYSLKPKPCYKFVKNAFAPNIAGLWYDDLYFDNELELRLFTDFETAVKNPTVTLELFGSNHKLFFCDTTADLNKVWRITPNSPCVLAKLTLLSDGHPIHNDVYFFADKNAGKALAMALSDSFFYGEFQSVGKQDKTAYPIS